ncbi:hypothetical protein C8R43DRAFT_894273 [Mycena crocata]|nr:hypothetical protein C8R43DRAFT_894273 [Mycena crocata]
MPLLKIACVIAATIGLHKASTSPNPPLHNSSAERKIAPTRLEFLLGSQTTFILPQLIYWSIGIVETTVLVAQFVSPSIWTQRILSGLEIGGDLHNVQPSVAPTLAIGSFLIICGAVLRLQCYQALGKHFTFETGIFKNHKLVTTGAYNIVRHPGYSGAFLAYVGLMLYYTSPGSWVMECVFKGSTAGGSFGAVYALLMFFIVLGLTWRIPKEDEGLRNEFGEDWDTWAEKVRYVLIPGVY